MYADKRMVDDMQGSNKVPLTREAYERLRAELEYLEGEGRSKVIEEISRARAHGDISENAEYHAAKDQQGMQEARAREIRQKLENAEIITGDEDQVVKPGKIVAIRYEGDDSDEVYLIGTREEMGGAHEVLTPDSPVGQALLGHAEGDVVSVNVPAGDQKVRIVSIAAR
jgi:transcription elongation factor GreA